jgi:hypothetical protein
VKPIFTGLLAALLLSGCATTTTRQYQWGEYEGLLYASYKDPAKVEELTVGLRELIAQIERNNQKVAPGLYAELGTLYLQAGSADEALSMYRKERDAWPESRGLMSALIQNLERQKTPAVQEEVAK